MSHAGILRDALRRELGAPKTRLRARTPRASAAPAGAAGRAPGACPARKVEQRLVEVERAEHAAVKEAVLAAACRSCAGASPRPCAGARAPRRSALPPRPRSRIRAFPRRPCAHRLAADHGTGARALQARSRYRRVFARRARARGFRRLRDSRRGRPDRAGRARLLESATMRITVLGKSPAWQDAGGACSGYLVEEGGHHRPARLRQRRLRQAARARRLHRRRRGRDLPRSRRPLPRPRPVRLRAVLTPRQQPVPVAGHPGTDDPARPRLIAPPGARQAFRTVVGAWGDEELIEQAFADRGVRPRGRGRDRRRSRRPFAEVPHFILTHAVELASRARRSLHLRRRLPPRATSSSRRPRTRPAARRGDAAAARADRHPRPHEPEEAGELAAAGRRGSGSCSPTSPTSSTPMGARGGVARRSAARSRSPAPATCYEHLEAAGRS